MQPFDERMDMIRRQTVRKMREPLALRRTAKMKQRREGRFGVVERADAIAGAEREEILMKANVIEAIETLWA